MLDTIQHIVENDMEPWKLGAMVALILSAIAWCRWQHLRDQRAMLKVAKGQARLYYQAAAMEIDEIGQRVAEHDRIFEMGQIDPDQEAIDAAIRESDAEEEEARAHAKAIAA